jgi:hypothetical protein
MQKITVHLSSSWNSQNRGASWSHVAHYNSDGIIFMQDFGVDGPCTEPRIQIVSVVEFLKNMMYQCEENAINPKDLSINVVSYATYITGMIPQLLSGKKDANSHKLKNGELWKGVKELSLQFGELTTEWISSSIVNEYQFVANELVLQ